MALIENYEVTRAEIPYILFNNLDKLVVQWFNLQSSAPNGKQCLSMIERRAYQERDCQDKLPSICEFTCAFGKVCFTEKPSH